MSRARNRLRAATTKEFDTKEIIQSEHIDYEQVAEEQQAASRACDDAKEELKRRMNEGEMCNAVVPVFANDKESMEAMTAAEITEKPGLLNLRHRPRFKQVDPELVDECKPHSQPRSMRISRSGMKGTRNKRQRETAAADEQQSTG